MGLRPIDPVGLRPIDDDEAATAAGEKWGLTLDWLEFRTFGRPN